MIVESRKLGNSWCWLIPKTIYKRFRNEILNQEDFNIPVFDERQIQPLKKLPT